VPTRSENTALLATARDPPRRGEVIAANARDAAAARAAGSDAAFVDRLTAT
jgi:gamma-glutamyl phosphate reductase